MELILIRAFKYMKLDNMRFRFLWNLKMDYELEIVKYCGSIEVLESCFVEKLTRTDGFW